MANLCRGERLESFSLRLVKLANEDSTRFKSSPSRVEATFERRCSSVRLLHHLSWKEGNATFRPIPIREGFLRNRLFSFRLENYSTEEVRESLAGNRRRGAVSLSRAREIESLCPSTTNVLSDFPSNALKFLQVGIYSLERNRQPPP